MAREKVKGLSVELNGDVIGLKKALSQASEMVNRYSKQLKTLDKALNSDPKNTDNIAKRQEVLRNLIKATTEEIEKFQDIQKQLDAQGVSHTSSEWMDIENRITLAKASLVDFKKQLSYIPASVEALKVKLDGVSKSTGDIANKMTPISALATAGLIGMTKEAVSYESNIANIKKVVKDLSDDTIKSLKDIAVQTGVSFDEISDYASMAGTLGIAEKDISTFAKTMTDLNTATSGAISGEEGAKSVARFLNIVKVGTEETSNFGSALTGVADQFATTADEVLATSSAMAGLASVFNVDQYDIIGISAVLQSLGVSSAVSASSITKTFQTIQLAVEKNGEDLEELAKTSGMSAKEFAEAWENKPMEAMLAFADGLQGTVFKEINEAIQTNSDKLESYANVLGMTKEQFVTAFNKDNVGTVNQYADALSNLNDDEKSAIKILDDLGLSGVRYSQTLLKLSGNGEKVKSAINDANKAWAENTALTDKANTIYESTEARLKGSKESLMQSAAVLGDSLLPVIDDVTDGVKNFSKWFANLDESSRKAIVGATAFTATLAPTAKGISAVTGGISSMIGGYKSLRKWTIENKDNLQTLTSSCGGFVDMTGKIVSSLNPVVLLLGGATVATVALYNAMSKARSTVFEENQEILDSIGRISEATAESTNTRLNEISNLEFSMNTEKETIDSLIEKYYEEKRAGQDTTATKEQIGKAIDDLNANLDGSNVHWDTNTGKIVDQNGKVVDLKNSINDLIETKQREVLMTEYSDAYDEALEKQKGLVANMEDATNNFVDVAERNKETLGSSFDDVKGNLDLSAQAFNQSLDGMTEKQKISALAIKLAYDEVVVATQNLNEGQQSVDNIQKTIGEISTASGETLNSWLQISQNSDLNFATARGDVDYLNTRMEELQEKLNVSGQYLGDENPVIQNLKSEIDLTQQALDLVGQNATTLYGEEGTLVTGVEKVKQAQTEALEQIPITGALAMDETEKDAEETYQNILSYMQSSEGERYSTIFDPNKRAFDDSVNAWNQTNFADKTAKVHVQFDYSGGSIAGYSANYAPSYGGGSGGLSQSGGITLNATFNVANNGQKITATDVNSWAVMISDKVSEILGGRI